MGKRIKKEHEWLPFTKHPEKFELVYIKFPCGKKYSAWWTGQQWDGLRPMPDGDPEFIKRRDNYGH